jgi:predicted nucleotide-binding protein
MTTFLKELGSTLNIRKNIRPIVLKIQAVRARSKRRNLGLNEIESDCLQNDKVYIIYGGSKQDEYKVRHCIKFIKNTLDLEPILYRPPKNPFFTNTLSSFDRLARDCSAAIVILSTDIETQAIKPNILLELGYFLGKFYKEKERKIIILHKPYEHIPSEFYGIPRISYHRSIKETFYQLKSQFRYWHFFI